MTPNVNGIYGCTYSFSPNYNPLANVDDGTCTSPDCSTNCGPGTMWDEQFEMCVPNASTCVQDLDNNGEVDTLDLLSLLGAFGSTCQ